MATPSSTPVFHATTKFQETVDGLNKANPKFGLVLNRILARMIESSDVLFSEAEEQQLQELVGMSASELQTLLDGCSYIFQQACFFDLTSETLGGELEKAGVKAEPVSMFQNAWKRDGGRLVETLRSKSFGGPKTLVKTSWTVNLPMAHTHLSAAKESSAVLEFDLKDERSQIVEGDKDKTKTRLVEMDRDELYNFFMKLEQIQEQIDGLAP